MEPMVWLFLGSAPLFSRTPAIVPTRAPASCSLKRRPATLECLRSVPLASVPVPSMIAEVNVRKLPRDGADRLGHQEADSDDEVIASGGEVRQVGNIVGIGMRLDDVPLNAKLALAAQAAAVTDVAGRRRSAHPKTRQVVKTLVGRGSRCR